MIKENHSLIGCMCIIFIGGSGYIINSILSHDSANPLCSCILCTNNHMPKDGEYLYNHYLFVLSIIWITFMVIAGYIVKEWTERVRRKNHKKRN